MFFGFGSNLDCEDASDFVSFGMDHAIDEGEK